MSSGYLEIILGPMFSGKTTKLMELYHYYHTKLNKKCLIIGHSLDCRYDKYKITSHDKREFLDCYKFANICEFIYIYNNQMPEEALDNKSITDWDVILIDECQFFKDITLVTRLVDMGKQVFLFGLDGDANQQLFGETYKLLPFCDKIEKLNGTCRHCGIKKGSIFSVCNVSFEQTAQIEVGGDEKYRSVCRSCLHNYTPLKLNPHTCGSISKAMLDT